MDTDETAAQPDQSIEHQHWWQVAPFEWAEEQTTPTTKRLIVVRYLRHCVSCGLAVLVLPSMTDEVAP